MKDKLFALFFFTTIVGTFTAGFVAGKQLLVYKYAEITALQVNQTMKTSQPTDSLTIVAKK